MVVFFGNLLILLLFTGLSPNANLHILMSFLIIISTPVGVVLLNESKESKAFLASVVLQEFSKQFKK